MGNLLNKYVNSKFVQDLQRVSKYGNTIKPTNLYEIRNNRFNELKSPIFFLSTGRCGTAWLTKLMEDDKSLIVIHNPENALLAQSKLFYELYSQQSLSENEWLLFEEMYLAAFENLFLNCIKSGKRLVFTESRTSFFAPIIAKLLPQAKFVHVYRHPGEFVRSGIRRGWYVKENDTSLLYKIKPKSNTLNWDSYSQIQKVSWLWNETNQFIEEFKCNIDSSKHYNLNFNTWTTDILFDLLTNLDIKTSKALIRKNLDVKVNVAKNENFDVYENWDANDKDKLKEICHELASKYNYNL